MQLVGRGMQSLRRAQWEGAGSRGGRVAGETEELEEGETRSDSDDEAFVDPDVDLSYIDEKLQHVLGHFQKEFEGEVSVENLGSKFGGYGSFLPTYQRSPLVPQSESPHIAANISTSGSPYQPSAERMDQNPSTVAVEPISRNNGSGAPSASDLLKKKQCPSTKDEESVAGSDSLDSSFSGSDSKSLKFQTKVCLNNDLPRENAVIYSGLGLDISSPSSMEESPDGLVPYESPRTILQVMTCFPVPGGFLLSPLQGNLLQLRNKVVPVLKDWETHLDMENVSRALEGHSLSFHPPGPIRGNVAKQMKPCSEKKVSMDTKTRKYKGDASAIMNMEVNIQVPASQNEKMMNTNNENGFEVGFARKKIPDSVKHRQLYMQPTSSVATMNADPVPAPVVIKDHWVRCDICQKFRLLPYGTNLSMLPKKWKCTMLHWLPGMNRCDISEDETTEALNALFAIPATATTFSSGTPQTAGTGTATSSAYNISGQFERSRKRKNAPSNGKDLDESSYHTPSLTPSMSNQQDPIRDERTTDDTRYSSERDSVSKHGPRPVSKSADLISEKLKPKYKNHSSYSDEGGIMEETKAHPKVKTKIGIDQDEQKTYKKTKIEDWHQIDRGQDHMCDSDGVEVPDEPKVLLAKAKTMKGSHETSDMSLRKENIALGYDLLENVKNVNALDVPFHSEKKEHPSGDKKDFNMEGRSPLPDQHSFDRMATALNTESGPVQHESKNIEVRQGSGTAQRLGMSFKKEKLHLRIDNQDIQNPVNQVVNFPLKEGKQKVCPTSVKSDSLKMKAKLVRFNVETGVQHGTVKQATSSILDTSPTRKDGSMITFALKEARDLKHKANDLKNKGQELESTDLYFEAALKFLHVAFLLETPSFDISRPGDGARSMKMYSETAKLCNFCAYEYERCKKMAAAALAYKCVEVAYLKAAYYKHHSASKDRQELQAAVQIARGESPSSSAPDIDNLNSHGLSKASLKGGNSPHVPGNHLPLAVHNQAHLLRLLAYTNDVNLAFDATRKAEFVIASAAGSQERGGVDDGLASVKTVLDLNFNNVNELLRLVRVSMESISS